MAYGNTNVPTGEKNVIERISVNGAEIAPINKKVDIPIPEAVTYDPASASKAGLMSAADKRKLDGIAAGAQVNPTSLPANGGDADTVNGHTVNADVPANAEFTDTIYGLATEEHDGLMSAADKAKLNGIPAGGLNVYAGTLSIMQSEGEIPTTSKPKLAAFFGDDVGTASSTQAMCFLTESGSYNFPGSQGVNFTFKDNGIAYSASLTNLNLKYFILC